MIIGAGLAVGAVARRFDAVVNRDHVIAQQPVAGVEVARGSSVSLTVSDGPAVTVPNVVGQNIATAANTITSLGLGYSESRRIDAAPIDTILSQQPTGGTQVKPGTRIDLVLSDANGVVVPDVINLALNDATNRISSAGLKVGVVDTDFFLISENVVRQNPAGGARLPHGAAVNLTKGKRPPGGGGGGTTTFP